MINGIERLKALSVNDWHKVRDISIPITQEQGGEYKGDIQGAICYTGSPNALRLCDTQDAGSILRATAIVKQANAHLAKGHRRFRLEVDGMSFRVQLGTNATSQDLQLRVLPSETPSLKDLVMPEIWRELMMDDALINGGLILITAPNGQGKTTTASACVKSRLGEYGGMANTIEDPIELPLQHAFGVGGVCYQRPVHSSVDFERPGEGYFRAMIDALRQFPAISGGGTILFVGEIRDGKTAAETLKAASNGHLVIATIHAKSVPTSVRRMMTLSSDSAEGMEADNVREMLSDSLRAVFSQRLVWQLEGEGWSSAKVRGDVLWSDGYDSAAAQAIRTNNLQALTQITNAQTLYVNKQQEENKPSPGIETIRDELKKKAQTAYSLIGK